MVGVRITGLTHEFEDREVFSSLDFAYDGSCLAVTGPNGSGKSTLLRILAGLLIPTSGTAFVALGGVPVPREHARDLIGLAAPDVRLYSELSPRENLRFLLKARGRSIAEDRVVRALERVGLAHRADDPVRELSSGLRQRAALAAALVHEPMVLLLDEPSSNLDETGTAMVREVIEEQARDGMVVIATNDPSEAALASAHLNVGDAR